MTLAYDYPLLNILLSMVWFFLLIVWIMTLFHVLGDIFRSSDMGGVAKAVWLLFVIVMPFLGVFLYLISRGDIMAKNAVEAAEAREAATQQYIRQAAGTTGVAHDLAQLAALRDSGAISEDDYAAGKAKILG